MTLADFLEKHYSDLALFVVAFGFFTFWALAAMMDRK